MSKKQKEQLRSGDTLPPLTRTFDLVRGSLDEESRTVQVTFSTENPVERWFGVEVLDHSAGAVRMDRITDGAPFLMDHDMRDQRGVVESAEIKGKEGRATIRFSRSERGQDLMDEVKDGIRTKISVGYRVHQFVITENGNSPDEYRATDWEPLEISSVSIPADPGARTRAEYDQHQPFGVRAAELGSRITVRAAGKSQPSTDPMNEKEKKRQEAIRAIAKELGVADEDLQRAIDNEDVTADAFRSQHAEKPEPKDKQEPEEGARASQEPKGVSPEDLQREIEKRVAADRDRCEEIRTLGREFGLSDDDIAKAIRENVPVERVKLDILERQRKDPSNAPLPTARVSEPVPTGERGSREFCADKWGRSALQVLRASGYDVPEAPAVRVLSEPRDREYVGGRNFAFHRSLTGALTLSDVAVLDAGIGAPIIDETTAHAPELGVFPVDVISGSTIELSVMTGLPTVGARNANEGTDWKKGTFESRIFQTAIIEERVGVDIQGVLNASKNPGRLLMQEASAVARAVAEHVGEQTWYGATAQSGADAKFAPGLYAQAETGTTHVVDAQGSSNKSSVWFLQLGTGMLDHVYGNDTTLNFRDSWMEETVEDSNGKKLRALTNYLSGRVAPRLANKNAAVRIKNLAASTQVLTDGLMFDALKLCEDLGMQPNAIFMTSRSLNQLRDSRTTYHPLGLPAPLPREFEGIPIYQTRNLSNAETI